MKEVARRLLAVALREGGGLGVDGGAALGHQRGIVCEQAEVVAVAVRHGGGRRWRAAGVLESFGGCSGVQLGRCTGFWAARQCRQGHKRGPGGRQRCLDVPSNAPTAQGAMQ